jgi:hypothetical protein
MTVSSESYHECNSRCQLVLHSHSFLLDAAAILVSPALQRGYFVSSFIHREGWGKGDPVHSHLGGIRILALMMFFVTFFNHIRQMH